MSESIQTNFLSGNELIKSTLIEGFELIMLLSLPLMSLSPSGISILLTINCSLDKSFLDKL